MKILLLSKADIFGNINLNILLKKLIPLHEIQILLSDEIQDIERSNPIAKEITYYERDYFFEIFLPFIDSLQLQKSSYFSFNGLKNLYKVPLKILTSQNYLAEITETTNFFQPDLLFCCRFDYILPQEIIELPKFGSFNTHSGSLPEISGPNAIFWTMYYNKPSSACSLHRIIQKIDAGNIVAKPKVKIDYSKSILENRVHIYQAGLNSFLEILPSIEKNTLKEEVQDLTQRKYFPFPQYKELLEFIQAGKKTVDIQEYNRLLSYFFDEDSSIKSKLPMQNNTPNTRNISWPK